MLAVDAGKEKSVVEKTVGNYDLLEMIAEGGMGTVYKARDKSSGALVAIKIVPPNVAKNHVLMKRFEQEYHVAKALDHPNVVSALEFGYHAASPYLVMEYVDGESLGQRIERAGKIPEGEAINIITQIAQALDKVHNQGLVHRDVKPDNVLVTQDGTAKLADLGLVKELETDLNLTRTGRGLGTPHFMAPEQFRNAKNADARCDVYSLAATLYMMLTGELPFLSTGPLDAWMKKINDELVPARQLVPTLSERVDWALRRAMSVDKDKRPATCREFVEDLTGHSTRKITPMAQSGELKDVWYLVYTDDLEVTRTVEVTLAGIRRSLKEGVLGDASNVRAARSPDGPFEPLRLHPQFRDLVLPLATATGGQGADRESAIENRESPDTTGASILDPRKTLPAHQPALPLTVALADSPPAAMSLAPHIDLETTSRVSGWLLWLTLLFCGGCLTAAVYFLRPMLMKH